jgi:hypothetical protein
VAPGRGRGHVLSVETPDPGGSCCYFFFEADSGDASEPGALPTGDVFGCGGFGALSAWPGGTVGCGFGTVTCLTTGLVCAFPRLLDADTDEPLLFV